MYMNYMGIEPRDQRCVQCAAKRGAVDKSRSLRSDHII